MEIHGGRFFVPNHELDSLIDACTTLCRQYAAKQVESIKIVLDNPKECEYGADAYDVALSEIAAILAELHGDSTIKQEGEHE